MLVVKKKQMEAFKNIERQKFISITIDFLKLNCPQWAVNNSNQNIIGKIEEIIRNCRSYNIHKASNIQRLLFANVHFKKGEFFTVEELELMSDEDSNESKRVQNLYLYLAKLD